jgi:hypothetical protein
VIASHKYRVDVAAFQFLYLMQNKRAHELIGRQGAGRRLL